MSRFFVSPEAVRGGEIFIEGNEARHLLNVLRLKVKDPVVIFDGTGKEYYGTIASAVKKHVVVAVTETKDAPLKKRREVVLFQAIPKKDRMDYIVEKATELGVEAIVPVITDRTVVRLDDERSCVRQTRWERIALSASEQCGRRVVPAIERPRLFSDAVASIDGRSDALIACLADDTRDIGTVLPERRQEKVLVFIGPEGDFTAGEVNAAIEKGAVPVSLGPLVMKSDTAGLAVIAMINYEYERAR
ncbi:MAG: 16S rRNA (uracil(1498)-N(3))-methyltransferase [Candidatus Omnitrophota bacterium]